MEITRKLAVTVGALFVGAALVGFLVVLFLGGDSLLFARTVQYHAVFPDVGGLRGGAVVRLGGRDVGDVTEIDFGPVDAAGAPTLVVTVRVRKGYADRVHTDSRARITSQGLLGDKLLEITLGSAATRPLADGGWLTGEPLFDTNRLLGTATDAMERARAVLEHLDELSGRVANSETIGDIEDSARALKRIVAGVERDSPRLTADARAAVAAYARAAARLEAVADHVDRVVAAVDPAKLRRATDDLASVAADVRAGRGTLGGLLVDPTLYEETKRILVNIERNSVLKALARMVVSDEGPDEVLDSRPVHPRPAPRVQAQGTSRLNQ
jgi:phospholipid/cholesterol/gamma-HCH transport system substrate-binding protein